MIERVVLLLKKWHCSFQDDPIFIGHPWDTYVLHKNTKKGSILNLVEIIVQYGLHELSFSLLTMLEERVCWSDWSLINQSRYVLWIWNLDFGQEGRCVKSEIIVVLSPELKSMITGMSWIPCSRVLLPSQIVLHILNFFTLSSDMESLCPQSSWGIPMNCKTAALMNSSSISGLMIGSALESLLFVFPSSSSLGRFFFLSSSSVAL